MGTGGMAAGRRVLGSINRSSLCAELLFPVHTALLHLGNHVLLWCPQSRRGSSGGGTLAQISQKQICPGLWFLLADMHVSVVYGNPGFDPWYHKILKKNKTNGNQNPNQGYHEFASACVQRSLLRKEPSWVTEGDTSSFLKMVQGQRTDKQATEQLLQRFTAKSLELSSNLLPFASLFLLPTIQQR